MEYVKNIRDPIHGTISLTDLELKLLDTPHMQRLRRIKQNGLCFMVYPAMNSTRFEHSLGVMHLAGLMSDHLGLSEDDRCLLRVAGLLHDVGHCPFSHTSDGVFALYGDSHEDYAVRIVCKTVVSDILGDYGIDCREVAELIKGGGRLGRILCSEIDVDKMDYLVRDSYYAGVAYGTIDLERIIYGTTMVGDDLVVRRGSLEAVEFLLISRNLMYETVYRHHTKRIVESMFRSGLMRLFRKKLGYEDFLVMDDVDVVYRMRHAGGYVQDIMRRIDERRLFKKVFQERLCLVEDAFKGDLFHNKEKIEERICVDYGVRRGYVILDIPEVRMSEFKVLVEADDGLKRIDEVSSLARALERSEQEKLTLCLYTAPEYVEKFRNFDAEKYIEFAQTRLGKFL